MDKTEQNIMKGCGKPEINPKTGNVMINCGDTLDEKFDYQEGVTYFHNFICSECRAKLQGYQLAQKETAEKVEKLNIVIGQLQSNGEVHNDRITFSIDNFEEFKKEKDKIFKDNTKKEAEK